ESLHAIEEGGKKASSLTQQILNFSKLNLTESPALVDGCALVSQTWKLLRGSIPPEFNLEYQVPESPLYLRAVEGKLAQVLINLVVNARDALSTGGTIEIALNPCSEKERVCELFGEKAEPANYAVLRVTDNGHGMSQDVLARAFEPYFSTKKDRGTGLGLSTVLTIVRSLGGAIDVHSQPGAGTEVEVFLPLAEESAQTEAVINSEPSQPLAGSGKVLVVDDEDPVRNVLSLSLLHLGYQVELAASGREALDKFASTAGSFDLVILDMLMPHISGDEVFFRMREINPKVRVLIISGYSSEEAVQRILQNGGKGFMQKPFTIEELSRKVRECLETG
ncbi:MAG: response regulator, partial [Deltaproteobacteria bacterium]|nr:response regulator [Deltaproteobacteria bacterium]